MDNRPIGVFDSGVGGLTIVSKMKEMFPYEDIIYVADTKNNPYGNKSKSEIEHIVSNVFSYLESRCVKMIVIACNTATIYSDHLKHNTHIPYMGVVYPTAKTAFRTSENNQILILATQATIQSNVYQDFLAQKKARFIALATPEFVEIVEQGNVETDESLEAVLRTLSPYRNSGVDTVLLGCTHFGLIEPLISIALPNTHLVDSADAICEVIDAKLELLHIKNEETKGGELEVVVTGNLATFQKAITWFKHPINKLYTVDIK